MEPCSRMRGTPLEAKVLRSWRKGLRNLTAMAFQFKKTQSAISRVVSRLQARGAISGKPERGRPRISDQRKAKIIQAHWRKPLSWLRSKCSAKTFKRRVHELIRWRRFRAMRKTPTKNSTGLRA